MNIGRVAINIKSVVVAALLSLTTGNLNAQQNDPIVFEIGGDKVTATEFKEQFLKGVGNSMIANMTTAEKRQALNEYADLYINYLTKLKDAYALGLDTTNSLRHELRRYRNELAAPYLIDSNRMQRM